MNIKDLNVKELRKGKGMTQLQLALAVDVSVPTIQYWEAGVSTPTDENMAKLKEVLEVE